MVSWTFPATKPDQRTIRVEVEAEQSLLDFGDRDRVFLPVGDEREVGGLAESIDRADARDIPIRTKALDEVVTRWASGTTHSRRSSASRSDDTGGNETRHGACRDFIT